MSVGILSLGTFHCSHVLTTALSFAITNDACISVHWQELIEVTRQKMMTSIQDKIRRLHEEKVTAELTKGS